MSDRVRWIDVFSLTTERDVPYLGSLRQGECPNDRGYFVRTGNGTVYPTFDRSVLVRIETDAGVVGWGETYGLVAPGAIAEIINDLLEGFVIGRDPSNPVAIYDSLYGLMRVRGYTGGFYHDALAAIDIALWDIAGRMAGKGVGELIGETEQRTIPAYFSGLPESSAVKRAELALEWLSRGFDSFKFAAPVADDGVVTEFHVLRGVLGEEARIAADLHWAHTAESALHLANASNAANPWFIEAPLATEDISGLAEIVTSSPVPVAVGEEWRTVFDMQHRTERCNLQIVQPEMGHTGITSFIRICELASQKGIEVIPHATIGSGIFLAASLKASSAMGCVSAHEYQNSIFEPNRRLVQGEMDCSRGAYTVPAGAGIGVEPSGEALDLLGKL